MAIPISCQNLGAAVFLTLAQTVFSNSLHSAITKDAPERRRRARGRGAHDQDVSVGAAVARGVAGV